MSAEKKQGFAVIEFNVHCMWKWRKFQGNVTSKAIYTFNQASIPKDWVNTQEIHQLVRKNVFEESKAFGIAEDVDPCYTELDETILVYGARQIPIEDMHLIGHTDGYLFCVLPDS